MVGGGSAVSAAGLALALYRADCHQRHQPPSD